MEKVASLNEIVASLSDFCEVLYNMGKNKEEAIQIISEMIAAHPIWKEKVVKH